MAVADTRVHTDGFFAAVDNAVSVPTLDGAAGDTDPPYVVVYTIDGGGVGGTLGDPDDDVEMPFQVTCVSPARGHCQTLQAAVRGALIGGDTVTVTGRSLFRVTLERPSGVRVDDELGEAAGRRYYTTDVFHMSTVP